MLDILSDRIRQTDTALDGSMNPFSEGPTSDIEGSTSDIEGSTSETEGPTSGIEGTTSDIEGQNEEHQQIAPMRLSANLQVPSQRRRKRREKEVPSEVPSAILSDAESLQ
jgi:hypothetical protein